MSRTFKLDGREPLPCTFLEWAEWFESDEANDERNVAFAGGLRGGACVSTYFVGLLRPVDLLVDNGPPLLFESQVRRSQGDPRTDVVRRYATWAEAEAGHREIVDELERGHAEGASP